MSGGRGHGPHGLHNPPGAALDNFYKKNYEEKNSNLNASKKEHFIAKAIENLISNKCI